MSDDDRHPRDRLERALHLRDATLLIVSAVIGSGIFLTPGAIAERLPHPGLIFAVWAAGGLLSVAGALANAELGAMYPHAGGDYVYLREAYHPLAGFLVGWLTFFVIYAGTIATLAAGFAESLANFVPLTPAGQLALAIAVTLGASALNFVGVRWGARANNLTALLKVAALVGFCAVAPFAGRGDVANLRPLLTGAGSIPVSAFGLALTPVLFSYLGWNSAVYVASEIREPSRNVPRSLFLGIGLCTAIYLLVNAVYLYALPVAALEGQVNAGEAAGRALFGELGGSVVGLLVVASILGTLNATILVGPRIAYAMALDGLFFRGLDRAHAVYRTPSAAIALQALVSVGILLLFGVSAARSLFQRALEYTTFAIILATMADVAALYTLRSRQPDRPRPYRAWGYSWLPATYLLAHAGIAAVLLAESWFQCVAGLLISAAGLPFYAYFSRSGGRGRGA